MKQEWSNNWVASVQPRKQRKYRANAPLHVRRKFMAAGLSKELRKQMGRRSVPLRKGDEVKVMSGSAKRSTGTVNKVDLSRLKVFVDGITSKKVDGSEVMRALEPSNLMITKLSLDDKERRIQFERAGKNRPQAKSDGKAKVNSPASDKITKQAR